MMQRKQNVEKNCESKKASMEEIYIKENKQVNKSSFKQIDVAQLSMDPGLRTPIMDYNVNLRDQLEKPTCKEVCVNIEIKTIHSDLV